MTTEQDGFEAHETVPTEAREVEYPQDATHREILEQVFERLKSGKPAVINGPSHAGKSTFLTKSLDRTFVENGFTPIQVNCMASMAEDVVPELALHQSVVVLDETLRLPDEEFMTALKERVERGQPTVICATDFEDHPGTREAFHKLLRTLEVDSEDVINFPVAMTESDAVMLVTERLGKFPPEAVALFAHGVAELTTQPYLLRYVVRAASAHETLPEDMEGIKKVAQEGLAESSVDESLKAEARALWAKVTDEPLPRWYLDQEELDNT